MRVPDNEDIRAAMEARHEMRLAQRIKCERCKEPKQNEDYYSINGEVLCKRCMDNEYRIVEVDW